MRNRGSANPSLFTTKGVKQTVVCMIFERSKQRSEFRLGSALFGISDPDLVKKSFFETFLSKKLTGGGEDEISEIHFGLAGI